MSISMRSTKAQMYSEIERLRELCDLQSQQLRAALDKAEREPALSEPTLSERGTRNLMMKRLAVTCKAPVKWVDGQGFRQYKDGNWVVIPAHTIQYVAKGIGQ